MSDIYYRPSKVERKADEFNKFEITLRRIPATFDNEPNAPKEIVFQTDNKTLALVLDYERPTLRFVSHD